MQFFFLFICLFSYNHLIAQTTSDKGEIPTIKVQPKIPEAPVPIITPEPILMFPDSTCLKRTGRWNQEDCFEQKWLTFIAQYLRYPDSKRQTGLEPLIGLTFVVGVDGLISNIRTIKGAEYPLFVNECIRVLNLVVKKKGPWFPVQFQGVNQPTQFYQHFKFKLPQ